MPGGGGAPEGDGPAVALDWFRMVDGKQYAARRPFMPLYPGRELTGHVAAKGVQLGACVGLFVLVPSSSLVFKRWRGQSLGARWSAIMPLSAPVGCAFALSMLLAKAFGEGMTSADVDERAYRIANNAGQVRTDLFAAAGLAGGAAAALRSGRNALALGSTGIALGVAAHVVLKAFDERPR